MWSGSPRSRLTSGRKVLSIHWTETWLGPTEGLEASKRRQISVPAGNPVLIPRPS